MPSVKFFLKKVVNGSSLIMVTFTFNTERIRMSTGEKIDPKYWIQGRKGKKSRAINSWEFKGDEVNLRMKKIEDFLLFEYRKQLNDGKTPSRGSLHDSFMIFLNKKSGDRVDLFQYFDEFINRTDPASKIPGKKYAKVTHGRYKLVRSRLIHFQRKTGYKVDFDTINKKFYESFLEYLHEGADRPTKKGKKKPEIKDVTRGNAIKYLKHLLNEAVEDGVTDSLEHRKKYFHVFGETADSVFLSVPEIEKIYAEQIEDEFTKFKRDMFVLSCYTGLRFSDWKKYTPDNIIEAGKYLSVLTKKTGELVVIPLSSIAREILAKYQGSSFSLPSNVKMNKTLKEIGQLAEMHQTMNVSSTSGGIVTTVLRKKWQLITTHTARRSFATNAFLSGIPTISIMQITGHKTERSFLKYIRVSKLENAMKMAEHPFFK